MEIARRFNAGQERQRTQVPKGRLDVRGYVKIQAPVFGRPFGTYTNPDLDPALKRRAISGYPFGISRQGILKNSCHVSAFTGDNG